MRKRASVRQKAACTHVCAHAQALFQGSAQELGWQLRTFSKSRRNKSDSIAAIPLCNSLSSTAATMLQAAQTDPFWLFSLTLARLKSRVWRQGPCKGAHTALEAGRGSEPPRAPDSHPAPCPALRGSPPPDCIRISSPQVED